jgi:flavorubredoxin/flavin reductase (DIM6/NTAB) family NADH-FMN oxidoreductase RutF
MVAIAPRTQTKTKAPRLTIQTKQVAADTTVMRCLDWDRSRFDIEFALNNGTTYNSFLIQAEKTALIDTSHQKFRHLYLDLLKGKIDPNKLDYLIISHTEPDHSGLVKDVLAIAPNVTVVGAKVAIQFLENMVHQSFQTLQVKSGDKLDLGGGHELEFISAPNLHWPDTIFTFDRATQTLFTCDAFGMHFCDDNTYDEEPELLNEEYQQYYDCLMKPNARSVLGAIKRIEKLNIETIATGHGPLLKHHIPTWVGSYRDWSQEQAKTETLVALFYTEDYGDSAEIARSIGRGIEKTGVGVELVDLNEVEPQEIRELVGIAAGIVLGMPPQDRQSNAQKALGTILAAVHNKQSFGLFESGGGNDEPLYPLRNKFRELGLYEAFPSISVKEETNSALLQRGEEAGLDLGQWLTRDRTLKQLKAFDNEMEKALGRISGGLYIITAQKGDISSAMLASWVTQVSFEPLGISIAVAKDRAMESLLQVGDRFVLNVLEEGNYQSLMKHFLKRFLPGDDRFAGIKTYPATNGSPILADALAYLECEVNSRMDANDHWIVYSSVDTGRVAKLDGLTAVHHRKIGNHY